MTAGFAGVVALAISRQDLRRGGIEDVGPGAGGEARFAGPHDLLLLIHLGIKFVDGHAGDIREGAGERPVRHHVVFIFDARAEREDQRPAVFHERGELV